jgi:hypothetical protein
MDTATLLFIAVPLALGLVFNAVRFMRFVGFLAGAGRRATSGNRGTDGLSFDDRVAERLRELERETHAPAHGREGPTGFGRREA